MFEPPTDGCEKRVRPTSTGTSIGALEELIGQLGLGVEQVMVPIDHVLFQDRNLPSIAVILTGTGTTHYVVAWRTHGRWVQVMDPAAGRRFMRAETFERALYRHEHAVDAAAWREWAASEDFTAPLASRLEQIGVEPGPAIERALADPSWRSLAALDASTRLLKVLATSGSVSPEAGLEELLWSFVESATAELSPEATGPRVVPERYWSVWPDSTKSGESADAQLLLRGAVLLRVIDDDRRRRRHRRARSGHRRSVDAVRDTRRGRLARGASCSISSVGVADASPPRWRSGWLRRRSSWRSKLFSSSG